MPRLVVAPEQIAPAQTKQVVEEKKTTTTEMPAIAPGQILRPGARGPTPKNPSINEWYGQTAPDERANDYGYTLYRDDSRIIIVEENLDDRASGSMLYKFTADEIRTFPEGPFLQELAQWVKPRFGGGEFHIMVYQKKTSRLLYNKGFKIEGHPILSKREDWVAGQQPASMGGGGDSSVLPMLMKLIDEKLAAVTQNRQEPGAAVAEVTKAIMESNTNAYQWLLANMPKPPDPTGQLEQMRSLFGLFRDMQPALPAQTAADPMAQFTQFATMLRTIRELDAPREAPQTIKDMIQEGIKTALREAGGVRGGPRGTDWGSIAEKFAPLIVPLATAAFTKLQGVAAARQATAIQPAPGQFFQPGGSQPGGVPVFPRAGGVPGGPVGAPVGRPLGPPQPVQPAAPAAAQPPAGPSDQIIITEEVQSAVLWDHVTKQIVDMLTHDDTGDIAAAALEKMFPSIAVHIRTMNEESLLVMIKGDPELSKVKDDPRLPAFIKAFLQYFKTEETEGSQ